MPPPSLSRPLLRSLPRPSPASAIPSTTTTTTTLRPFTATPTSNYPEIPPEAPSWLKPPVPAQSEEPVRNRFRGYLPVPRDILPKKEAILKRRLAPSHIENTYPKGKSYAQAISRAEKLIAAQKAAAASALTPKKKQQGGEKGAEKAGEKDAEVSRASSTEPHHQRQVQYRHWKAKLSDDRRRNLEDGIKGLHARSERRIKETKERRNKIAEHLTRQTSIPISADEIMTRPTVLQSLLDVSVRDDPLRLEKAAASTVRTVEMLERHSVTRQDAMQRLYVNARPWIIDEEVLEEQVNTLFSDNYWANMLGQVAGTRQNVWETMGPPRDLHQAVEQSMMDKMMDRKTKKVTLADIRQKEVAEELSGAKIEE